MKSVYQTPGRRFFDTLNDLLNECIKLARGSTNEKACNGIGVEIVKLYSNTNYVKQDGTCVEEDWIKDFCIEAHRQFREAHCVFKIKLGSRKADCFRNAANAFMLLKKVSQSNGPLRVISEEDEGFTAAESKCSIKYPIAENVDTYMRTEKENLEKSH